MRRIVGLVALLGGALVLFPGERFLADDFAPPPRDFPPQIQRRLPARIQRKLPLFPGRRDSGGTPQTRLAPPGRILRQRLKRVRDALEAGNHLEVTQALQQFLDRDEEVFLPPEEDEKAPPQSLKMEVLRQLAELPPAAQELYELQNGPPAKRLLEEALEGNQPEKLVTLARRYLHTSAGSEGTYRLASLQLDEGNVLSAARLFDRLRQFAAPDFRKRFEPAFSLKSALAWQELGESEKAETIIRDLQRTDPKTIIRLGGEETPVLLKSPEQVLAWLEERKGPARSGPLEEVVDWRMVRGNATHTAASRTQAPYLGSFRSASLLSDLLEDSQKSLQLVREFQELSTVPTNDIEAPVRPTIPAFQPLAVGGLAVVRTFSDLRAYRLNTGELAWISAEKDDMLTRVIQNESAKVASSAPFLPPVGQALKQRAWRDATYGTICSDGKLVYAIEESDFIGSFFVRHPPATPGPYTARQANRLKAYDLQTGRLVAEYPAAEESGDNNRIFFLGPPLILDGHLYCIVESLGEIRLMVLRPGAPVLKVEWSQPLASAMTLEQDPYRRMCGLTPVARGGLIVCPTEAGAVVAIDLATRSFAWGNVYSPRATPERTSLGIIQNLRLISNYQQFIGNDDYRWIDSAILIEGDRLVMTPRDVDELHCLNLFDGKLLWKRPREAGLFVAAVHDGKVIVVSRGEGSQAFVQAYSLAKGEPAWPRPTSLPLPSGQGFRHGPYYYLPLSTAEVVTLNLTNGQIVAHSRSQQKIVPGNLAASGDIIVSQTPDSLHLFPQFDVIEVEVAKRLQANPRDAAALALRGEIEMQRGRTQAALVSFREALAIRADERPYRELLLSSLLEGLRVDFPTYRGMTAEIERLEPQPEQWGTYLLSLGSGLDKAGDKKEAFAAYLRLCETGVTANSLERINDTQVIRRDLFAYGQLRRIYSEATPPLRQELDGIIHRGYEAARTRGAPAELSRWLTALPSHIPSDETRLLVLDRLPKKGATLERERMLHELVQSPNKQIAGTALANLITLLVENGRAVDVLPALERLRRDYGEITLLEGKTGAALAAQREKQTDVARDLQMLRTWPTGLVESSREFKAPAEVLFPFVQVPVQESEGSLASGVRIELSRRGDDLVACDRFGREWWSLGIEDSDSYIDANQVRAWANGHLLLLALPRKLIAIDMLATGAAPADGAERSPRVIWQMALSHRPMGGGRFRAAPGGRARFQFLDENNQPTGAIGPVTERFIGVQRGKKLLGVDPLTGKILWIREDAGPLEDLTGDDELVLALPSTESVGEGKEAPPVRVYSTVDGSLLGTRPLPKGANRQAFIGRCILAWDVLPGTERKRLSLWDVWKESRRWEQTFPPGAVLSLPDRDEAAVMEPLGRLALLRTSDGRKTWETSLEPDPALQNLVVLRGLERYVAVASGPVNQTNESRVNVLDQMQIAVSGTAYGLNRDTGRRLWSSPVEPQAIHPLQSADLPVVVFACRSFVRQPAPRRYQSSPAILCLDSRTGRTIYNDRVTDDPFQTIRPVCRPESKTVELQLSRSNLLLKFTDKPLPAAEPEAPDKKTPPTDKSKSPADKKPAADEKK